MPKAIRQPSNYTEDISRRLKMEPLQPYERELVIVEEICQALKEMGGKYVLPFRFKNNLGNRTSHHLIFVSKHFKVYEIMKDIMAQQSSTREQGISSFEYSPADKRQPLLFELSRPLDDLGNMLVAEYPGMTLTMQQIYESHNVGKPYTKRNYRDALIKLEADGRIIVATHRKGSFADHVLVAFPPSQGRG